MDNIHPAISVCPQHKNLADRQSLCSNQGENDKCIKQQSLLKHFMPHQHTDINLVCLFLQVITLSDMSTPDGCDICGYHLRGERRPNQKIRQNTWPAQQETPTPGQKRLWRKYISSHYYLRYSTKWMTTWERFRKSTARHINHMYRQHQVQHQPSMNTSKTFLHGIASSYSISTKLLPTLKYGTPYEPRENSSSRPTAV